MIDAARPLLYWQDGTELLLTRQESHDLWSTPAPALGSGFAERIHSAEQVGQLLAIGYSLQALSTGSAPPGPIEPRFRFETLPDDLFIDGFESSR